MKLLLCKKCQDVVRLIDTKRTCRCGEVGGKYIDNLNAIYFGEMAVPIGFANNTLVKAVHKQPENGMGENFTAFVIPKVCSTYKLVLEHECYLYRQLFKIYYMTYYLKWLHFDSKLNKHVFKCVGLEGYSLVKCDESEIHTYFVSNKNEIQYQNESNITLNNEVEDKYNYSFLNKPLKADTIPLEILLQQK